MKNQGTTLLALSDDTVEIDLTPEEMQRLSRAAESARLLRAAPSSFQTSSPQTSSPQVPLPDRDLAAAHHPSTLFGPEMRFSAVAFVAFAVFVWWSVDHVFGQQPLPAPPVAAAVVTKPNVARPALITAPQNAVVKVKNPFDATEVFEFPAGTSAAESRQKVADLLLERARERRGQFVAIRPTPNLRAANLYRAP